MKSDSSWVGRHTRAQGYPPCADEVIPLRGEATCSGWNNQRVAEPELKPEQCDSRQPKDVSYQRSLGRLWLFLTDEILAAFKATIFTGSLPDGLSHSRMTKNSPYLQGACDLIKECNLSAALPNWRPRWMCRDTTPCSVRPTPGSPSHLWP